MSRIGYGVVIAVGTLIITFAACTAAYLMAVLFAKIHITRNVAVALGLFVFVVVLVPSLSIFRSTMSRYDPRNNQ